MGNSDFISGLVATAEPVAPRRIRNEVLALVLVAGVQLIGAAFYFGTDKVAMALGVGGFGMATKLAVFGLLAFGATALALWSFDPAARRLAPVFLGLMVGAVFAALVGLEWKAGSSLMTTFYPQYGVRCLFSIISLALPITMLLTLLMARGASTQPQTTAWMIGVAGASWGAFTYALQCPFVSVSYIGVWYLGGVLAVTGIARVILPKVANW